MKIGLAQINYRNYSYLPYSVGVLQAYVQAQAPAPKEFEFLPPLYARASVDDAARHLRTADVVAFSLYIWNVRISLAIAARVKALNPQTMVVVGGPQVPDRAEAFLREHPFIDVACHGEGEPILWSLLTSSSPRDWHTISSVSFVDDDGTFVSTPRAPRTRDLTSFPSPYAAGVFSSVLAQDSRRWSVAWETNRGCPFSCSFCDWGSAVNSKVHFFPLDRVLEELDWFGFHQIPYVFCCDANFGIAPRDIDIAEFAVKTHERYGYPKSVIVQNTKNATERAYAVQKVLASAGLIDAVDLAIQSNDATTLINIRRHNISSASFQDLQRRFKRDDINTYTDIILGLPGETYDSFADGVSRLIADGQHNRIKFSNLSILPNAEMAGPAYRQRYGLDVVACRMVNHSEDVEGPDREVDELQELVVATASMPRDAWVRTRVFASMTSLLHFGRLLHVPFVVLHELAGISYRRLVEAFTESPFDRGTELADIQEFFTTTARHVQQGGPEYHRDTKWLNVWLYFDEYLLIRLCSEDRLGRFYAEAQDVLAGVLARDGCSLPTEVLEDCIRLNQAALRLPGRDDDVVIENRYNVNEIYRAAVAGERVPLRSIPERVTLERDGGTPQSWEQWCRDVVLNGHRNNKGSLLRL